MVKVIQQGSMVCIIEKKLKLNAKVEFLLLSDLHFDHPKCNREMLKQHIEECVEKDGYILINGDMFCVMQGRGDKRHTKSDVRPEDSNSRYFDSIVENAVEFFLPYAEKILFIGTGNHETSVLKRLETDLLRKFVELMYYKSKHRIVLGAYHGWIWIKCIIGIDNKVGSGNTVSYLIYHNHGTGGEAPVTGGTIEDSRKMTQVEGMDAIWQGHNHNKYNRQVGVHYLDKNPGSLKAKFRIVEVIRTGSYKQEYTGNGWHIETNKSAKPLGGIWLTLIPRRSKDKSTKFLAPTITPTWHGPLEIEGEL